MRVLAVLAAFLLGGLPAQAATISLTLTGTDYEGGPAFFAEAGQYPVGAGVLAVFDRPQIYSFTIPDAALEAAGFIQVRFLNDRYSRGVGDRNLRVLAVSVNGTAYVGAQLSTLDQAGESVAPGNLSTSGRLVRILRPAGGWPSRGP
jgi:hypothetical protein